jgi:hypothetical protein
MGVLKICSVGVLKIRSVGRGGREHANAPLAMSAAGHGSSSRDRVPKRSRRLDVSLWATKLDILYAHAT